MLSMLSTLASRFRSPQGGCCGWHVHRGSSQQAGPGSCLQLWSGGCGEDCRWQGRHVAADWVWRQHVIGMTTAGSLKACMAWHPSRHGMAWHSMRWMALQGGLDGAMPCHAMPVPCSAQHLSGGSCSYPPCCRSPPAGSHPRWPRRRRQPPASGSRRSFLGVQHCPTGPARWQAGGGAYPRQRWARYVPVGPAGAA